MDGTSASATVASSLRCGDWRTSLADVDTVDAIVVDPPYGQDTHEGHNDGAEQMVSATGQATRADVTYAHWTGDDVHAFVSSWAPRCRGWFACMTSDDLITHYKAAYRAANLYAFAPLPVIQKRPRLLGDGPPSWTVYLMVARPRSIEFTREHKKRPGAYFSQTERLGIVAGAKPIDLMRAVVRDYSKPGELVCDPCAGGGTTLLAASIEGRRTIGAELDASTHAKAIARLARGYTPSMFE